MAHRPPHPSRVLQDLDRIAKGDLSALERFSRTPLHLCDWRVRISCAAKGHREVAIDVFRRSWLTHSGPQQDVATFADDEKKPSLPRRPRNRRPGYSSNRD